MTKIELQDNLVFLSALKLLEQLAEKGLLTVDERRSPALSWSASSVPLCCSPEQALYENS
mgnify:CR=1 FL=1